MMKQFKELKLNKDYKYSYPRGEWDTPDIEVISGKYKGLKFELQSSAIVRFNNKDSMNYTYKLLDKWKDISNDQFDGKSVTLNLEDQNYMSSLVFCFLNETSFKSRTFSQKMRKLVSKFINKI